MKKLMTLGLLCSLASYAQSGAVPGSGSQGTGYAPNDGSAIPGNPGTGLGTAAPATTGRGTDVNGAETLGSGSSNPSSGMGPSRTNDVTGADQGTTLESSNSDPTTQKNENLNRSNTSVTPVPEDTDDLTLQGKTQTGPYRTPGNKQSQESEEEGLDYRAIDNVAPLEEDTENQ